MKKSDDHTLSPTSSVAIIGGGPGGLLTAHLLSRYAPNVIVTIFESSSRLGGKVNTVNFPITGARYEAGAAELYDYSHLGPDPLKELVAELELNTTLMNGRVVIYQGNFICSPEDMQTYLGREACDDINCYTQFAINNCTPAEYYESDWKIDLCDPLSKRTHEMQLSEVKNVVARRYIEVISHSDLATKPSCTSAMYGLQNWLMNEPDYMRLYSIVGGLEKLTSHLLSKLNAIFEINTRVTNISKIGINNYSLTLDKLGCIQNKNYNYVVAALPILWLKNLIWNDAYLAKSLDAHIAHYNYPAHYLRVTIVFKTRFWADYCEGSYFILDAFGGCCVYDESLRDPGTPFGVLGWLLAGDSAVELATKTDLQLFDAVIASLPDVLRSKCSAVLEGSVHRWVGAVNGWPMGYPIKEPDSRHQPAPESDPNIFLVGDYLFDSTLNGVFDSADTVAQWIAEDTALL